MSASTSNQRLSLTRLQAARMLRAAHRAVRSQQENAGELVGWALSAMRENRHAARLKIDLLLHLGQFDSADALIARNLLRGDDHPLMRLRFARSLFAQDRLPQAMAEVQNVLLARPLHIGALRLGGAIAARLGEHAQAVVWLITAHDERPGDESIRVELIDALLRAGLTIRARTMLDRWAGPPELARAAVLLAEGRLVEATEVLQNALRACRASDRREAIALRLLDAIERSGGWSALTELIELCPEPSDPLSLRIAQALLLMGDAPAAVRHLERLLRRSPANRDAHAGLMAIHATRKELDAAEADLERVQAPVFRGGNSGSRGRQPDRRSIAGWWLRAMLGQLVTEQADGRLVGSDPSISLLQPMLEQAVAVLSNSGHDEPAPAREARQDRMSLRKRCLEALGDQSPLTCDFGRQAA